MTQEEYTEFSPRQKKRRDMGLVLQCLQEEAAEVIQIASKINRFGEYSFNPYEPEPQTNNILIHQEIADFLAVLDVLDEQTEFDMHWHLIKKFKAEKRHKLEMFLPYIND